MLTAPTAKQSDADGQATPSNSLNVEPAGCGLGVIVHAVPSQCSTSGTVGFPDWPTAKQFVALTHVTAESSAKVAPAGMGAATSAQLVPFHASTSGRTLVPVTGVREAHREAGRRARARDAVELAERRARRVRARLDRPRGAVPMLDVGRGSGAAHPPQTDREARRALAHASAVNRPVGGPAGFALGATVHAGAALAGATPTTDVAPTASTITATAARTRPLPPPYRMRPPAPVPTTRHRLITKG